MLCEAARTLGLQTVVLAEKKSDCAIPLADEVVFKTETNVFEKLNQVDVLTIENEFVDLEWLKSGIKRTELFPTVTCLARIQDKLQQKKSLAATEDYRLSTLLRLLDPEISEKPKILSALLSLLKKRNSATTVEALIFSHLKILFDPVEFVLGP